MKPHRLRTLDEIREWVFTLPGNPRVKIVEYQTHNFGAIVFMFHRNHRRRFKLSQIKAALPIGAQPTLKHVAHSALTCAFETEMR